ncbi:universal stress protein [Pseudonocardia sp. MH-G8]|uniref:universal stress protein n=1 Tax=Pseudonocardia sp. MH-G8 TaxID=1854588 RepID=UPI000BA05A8F|nr:universal stress protein [Pseudonocardia sp. MH-G8]OZM77214.1 universal stress protein UspA [Pseudonocardia sp. MH-G8]
MPERENAVTPVRPPGSPFHPHDVDDALQPEALQGGEKTGPTPGREEHNRRPTVVVGIDGSDEAEAAVHWAVRHAQVTGAAVRAVAVWDQPVQFGDGVPLPAEEFEAEARAWLTAALPELRAAEPGAEVDTRLERGDPATVLLGLARDADLLVLGNHGRGAVAGVLLGSVAQRCAQRARCPVVLVPRPRRSVEV